MLAVLLSDCLADNPMLRTRIAVKHLQLLHLATATPLLVCLDVIVELGLLLHLFLRRISNY